MEKKDYYEILGVERDSDQKKIKEAYRKLALKYHPDLNKEQEAAIRMKEINESYAVLSNPQKKEQYDMLRNQFGSSAYNRFRQSYTERDIFNGSDVGQIFEELSKNFGFRGFDEIFRDFYGPGYQSFGFRGRGLHGQGFVFRGFGQKGRARPNTMKAKGLGRLVRYALRRKWGIELPESGKDRYDNIKISPELAGRGGRIRYLYRQKSRELIVNIPRGIREGQKIRLRGQGDPGRAGGASGDLYLTVNTRGSFWGSLIRFLKSLFPVKR